MTRWSVQEVNATPSTMFVRLQSTSLPIDVPTLTELLQGEVYVHLETSSARSLLVDELVRMAHDLRAYRDAVANLRRIDSDLDEFIYPTNEWLAAYQELMAIDTDRVES